MEERALKDKQRYTLSQVTKCRNELMNYMVDENNLHKVKDGIQKLNELVNTYVDVHEKYTELISEEDVLDKEEKRFNERQSEIFIFRKEVQSWIAEAEYRITEQLETISQKSVTSISRLSVKSTKSTTSVISESTREKLKVAELEVQKQMLKHRYDVQLQAEELKLNEEIAKAQARRDILLAEELNIGSVPEAPVLPVSAVSVPVSDASSGNISMSADLRGTRGGLMSTGEARHELSLAQEAGLSSKQNLYQPKPPGVTLCLNPRPQMNQLQPPLMTLTENDQSKLNPTAKVFEPPTVHNDIKELVTALTMPKVDIGKFNGDLIYYRSFMNAFDSRIASCVVSDSDKLYFLDQYLLGEPKELISSCFFLDPSIAYSKARKLLDNEYGDSYRVSMLYVDKITNWPVVKPGDGEGLKQFSLHLTKCCYAIESMSYLNVLNHSPNMVSVVKKLPSYLQNKWRDHAAVNRQQGNVLKFVDLVNFVVKAADAANDPVYGTIGKKDKFPMRDKYDSTNSSNHSTGKQYKLSKSSSFAANTAKEKLLKVNDKCPLCENKHSLDDCKDFTTKNIDDKKAFLLSKHLCFACFQSGHISKNCTQKKTCDKCKKPHPTQLHVENFKPLNRKISKPQPPSDEENASSCAITNCNQSTVFHSILPVKVQQGTGKEIMTYAFYDPGSSGCFITEELFEDLNATGVNTNLQLQTLHGITNTETIATQDLIVTDIYKKNPVCLPKTFTQKEIPVDRKHIPRPQLFRSWPEFQFLSSEIQPIRPDLYIGLLIGNNCPKALEPLKVVSSNDGPYAVLLRHGWTINGPIEVYSSNDGANTHCNRISVAEIKVKEVPVPQLINQMFELDFTEHCKKCTPSLPDQKGDSIEDTLFMDKVRSGIRLVDGHYEVPMPFRQKELKMPNNRTQALSRLMWQKKKMAKSQTYKAHYATFMNALIENKHCEKVPKGELQKEQGKVWYLPHHGVYHPHKPDKIRVVFDASGRFEGKSLNDELLQGPDLTNSLAGVLCRFRQESTAFMADIKSMFYQVKVPHSQADYLRFLWWPNADLEGEVEEYRMLVHLFGAVSSPSVANFTLKYIADEVQKDFGEDISNTIRYNFYVDDCLKSLKFGEPTLPFIDKLVTACATGGFKLTKFVCNSRKIIDKIPHEELSKELQVQNLDYGQLPMERALGIQWDVQTDCFSFSVGVESQSATRRNILSTISSVYDPLGFLAPMILPAKCLLQELCQKDIGWDEKVPDDIASKWNKWCTNIHKIKDFKFKRCFKPDEFLNCEQKLHIFCDASTKGYGAVAYLVLVNENGATHCSFVMGKSRVAPLKQATIPRLELTSATVALRLGCQLSKELGLDPKTIQYHTDSTTVLHYINNEKSRFPVFVANRIQTIRKFSDTYQWRYVPSEVNPADDASRGLLTYQFIENKRWITGPEFLIKGKECWPTQPVKLSGEDEVESHCINTLEKETEENHTQNLLQYFSNWMKLKRAVAVYHKYFKYLRSRIQRTERSQKLTQDITITVEDLKKSEFSILKFTQREHFKQEIHSLEHNINGSVSKNSCIVNLDPYLEEGLLRVGGRLRKSNLPQGTKHPILLSHKSNIAKMVIQDVHVRCGHSGRNLVVATLRESFWITHVNSLVRKILARCIVCRKQFREPQPQKMADLPFDRTNPAPPFTCTGVDYFGPYLVKEGRRELKRYGVIFTCLSSRAVHLETANTLDTDSCINALRRFIARRGVVKVMYSDNGTNFVGTDKELFRQLDHKKIGRSMLSQNVDWKFNVPSASHAGGIWERLIKSAKQILYNLLKEHGGMMDDEAFRTFLCEVECILNSRPLTALSDDPKDTDPLTPNHLLTVKPTTILPPPGKFERSDLYVKRRWRRVQYLSDLFWSRWKKEYLSTLQVRQKWNKINRNVSVGDLVLVKDENMSRNQWPLGRIIETMVSKDGLVRSVTLKTQNSVICRPVTKVIVILKIDEQ